MTAWPTFARLLGGVCLIAAATGSPVVLAEAPLSAIRPQIRMVEAPARPVARPAPATAAHVSAPVAPEPGHSAFAAPVERRKAPFPGASGQLGASEMRIANGASVPSGIAELAGIFEAALVLPGGAAVAADPPVRPDIRPVSRPGAVVTTGPAPLRPVARSPRPPGPVFFNEPQVPRIYGAATLAPLPEISDLAVALALRPPERPERITRAAEAARAARARGAVCGNLDIQGTVLGSVPGPGACGVEGAVRVTSVAGVRLSTPATMDCTTAQALHRWVETGARPAIGNAGGGLASMQIVGHYSCRTRANSSRLSEHAFGRAIDIAGFDLRDGTRISLIRHWNSSPHAARLRQMHQAACRTFGTVLGPEADAAHRDHFHFDTARYRSGSYCR